MLDLVNLSPPPCHEYPGIHIYLSINHSVIYIFKFLRLLHLPSQSGLLFVLFRREFDLLFRKINDPLVQDPSLSVLTDRQTDMASVLVRLFFAPFSFLFR